MLFTSQGIHEHAERKVENDFSPIDEFGTASVDKVHTKAYLRHLFIAKELLAMQIASVHNLAFYLWLEVKPRKHIEVGDFTSWKKKWLLNWEEDFKY